MSDFILSVSSGIIGGLVVLLFQRYWDFKDKKKREVKENSERQREQEQSMIIDPTRNVKYVDTNIVNSLLPGTSIIRMKDILGTPESYYREIMNPNTEDFVNTNAYYYNFLNGKILITSKEDTSIDSITIQSSLDINYPIKLIYPFNEHITGYLGEVRVTEAIIRSCVSSFSHRTARDAYFGIETYFGNIGQYYNYTFFGNDVEKIYNYTNNKDIKIFLNCVIYSFCISSIEHLSPYVG